MEAMPSTGYSLPDWLLLLCHSVLHAMESKPSDVKHKYNAVVSMYFYVQQPLPVAVLHQSCQGLSWVS